MSADLFRVSEISQEYYNLLVLHRQCEQFVQKDDSHWAWENISLFHDLDVFGLMSLVAARIKGVDTHDMYVNCLATCRPSVLAVKNDSRH